jgi:hypothetical protein
VTVTGTPSAELGSLAGAVRTHGGDYAVALARYGAALWVVTDSLVGGGIPDARNDLASACLAVGALAMGDLVSASGIWQAMPAA